MDMYYQVLYCTCVGDMVWVQERTKCSSTLFSACLQPPQWSTMWHAVCYGAASNAVGAASGTVHVSKTSEGHEFLSLPGMLV